MAWHVSSSLITMVLKGFQATQQLTCCVVNQSVWMPTPKSKKVKPIPQFGRLLGIDLSLEWHGM
jgi:hypothetical protein